MSTEFSDDARATSHEGIFISRADDIAAPANSSYAIGKRYAFHVFNGERYERNGRYIQPELGSVKVIDAVAKEKGFYILSCENTKGKVPIVPFEDCVSTASEDFVYWSFYEIFCEYEKTEAV